MQFIGTQPVPVFSRQDDEDDDAVPVPSFRQDDEDDDAAVPSDDSFEDIDDILAKIPSPTAPQTAPSQTAPSLYSLSQKNLRASQLPPTSSATTTRGSRGVVAKKSKAQLEMESQQRAEQTAKQVRAEERKNAAARKVAKSMKPRKEDVSQLIDEFSELRSSQ